LNHRLIARVLLSFLCGCQGIATLVIDLNRTHATNPHWTPHARFHLVWQTATVALLAALELGLVWVSSPFEAQAFYLAVLLAMISPIGFLIACLGRRRYGGALSDSNGIPPLRFKAFGLRMTVDLNLAVILVALVVLGVIIRLYR
jgi:hypothetical protein